MAILLAIKQLFNLRIGAPMLEGMYLYTFAALFLSVTFLTFRVNGRRSAQAPWYDWGLAFAALGLGGYVTATAFVSVQSGWKYAAP